VVPDGHSTDRAAAHDRHYLQLIPDEAGAPESPFRIPVTEHGKDSPTDQLSLIS